MLITIKATLGAVLLTFGRELDWLVAAGIGFLTGLRFAPVLLGDAPGWSFYLLAAAGAVVAGLVIVIERRLGLVLAGLLGGGYFLVEIARYGLASGPEWLRFLVGGIAGAFLLWIFSDWALIVLSSLIGAYLVVEIYSLSIAARLLLMIGLTLVGGLFQALLFRVERGNSDRRD